MPVDGSPAKGSNSDCTVKFLNTHGQIFEHPPGTGTTLTLITGGWWQMGLPCIVTPET